MRALLLGRGHEALQLRRKAGPLAEKAHLELVALHDRERFFHIFVEDAHDRAHFLGRAAPVFRGKGVDREVFDADGLAVVADAAKRLGAVGMAGRARQAALFGPAAVAVEDNRHMARQAREIHLRRSCLIVCHSSSCTARMGGACRQDIQTGG